MADSWKAGARGPHVFELQNKLLALGYHLPRWGADGDLGDETLQAVEAFRSDRGAVVTGDELPGSVSAATRKLIDQAFEQMNSGAAARPVLVDLRAAHAGDQQRGLRPWSAITGITLHQTAVVLGEKPERWFGVPVHIGVTRAGRILVLNALESITWHGNSFNADEVGIEVDGYFEGVEGDRKTFWSPPGDPREPLTPTAVQVDATRQAVEWICEQVAAKGGRIRFIHAHRQSSRQREGDPGSRLWGEVGVWAQKKLGLSDGGTGFIRNGLPIPEVWDPARKGVKYRT